MTHYITIEFSDLLLFLAITIMGGCDILLFIRFREVLYFPYIHEKPDMSRFSISDVCAHIET